VNERVAQGDVCPMEPGLAGGDREPQPPCHFSMCEPFYIVQKDHIPLLYREAAEGLLQYKLIGGSRPLLILPRNAVLRQILNYESIAALLFSCVEKERVECHSVQPRPEFRVTSKRLYLSQNLHKDVMGQIFRII